jgi:hypothetical protein
MKFFPTLKYIRIEIKVVYLESQLQNTAFVGHCYGSYLYFRLNLFFSVRKIIIPSSFRALPKIYTEFRLREFDWVLLVITVQPTP